MSPVSPTHHSIFNPMLVYRKVVDAYNPSPANQDTNMAASSHLGSLRPIIAQRTTRYDVVNKCVASIVNPFMKH